jgi:DNA gyrase subunit B
MSDELEVFTVVDAVRRRPAMYVGDTGPRGALNLVMDVVLRAADEHRDGQCHRVDVSIEGDTVVLQDDGPGMPLDAERFLDVPITTRPWPRTGGFPPARPAGHALGVGTFRALCRELDIATVHDGRAMRVRFRDGELVEPLGSAPSAAATGTTIRLSPDQTIFGHEPLPRRELVARLEALARELPDLRLTWSLGDVAP